MSELHDRENAREYGLNAQSGDHPAAVTQPELQVILDALPAWIYIKDRDNRFLRVNSAFATAMGLDRSTLEGMSCFDLFPREQAEQFWKEDREVISSGEPGKRIISSVTTVQGLRWVQTDRVPFRNEDGDIIGVICMASDITDVRHARYQGRVMEESREDGVNHGGCVICRDEHCVAARPRDSSNVETDETLSGIVSVSSENHGIMTVLPGKTTDREIIGSNEKFSYIFRGKKPEFAMKLMLKAIDSSPVCVVITDREGNIEYVNPKFEQLTGYTLDDVLGKNPRILKSGLTTRETYNDLWRTILSGEEWTGEFENVKKNGEHYMEAARIAPIFDERDNITHFVAVKEDVTERLLLKKAMITMSGELQIILDTLPAWVFYKDKENRFIRVNKAFAEAMGMTRELMEGVSCFDLFPREQAEEFWRDDLEVIASGQPKDKIVESVTTVDGLRWVQTEKVPLRNENGAIIGVIGFANDLTERKMMEDRIRQLAVTDELTGLSNRRGFFYRAEEAFKIAQRSKLSCMLFIFDLDCLKLINDTLGHSMGDAAIIETANLLRAVFRDSDVIGRLGGDEFAVFLIDSPPENADEIAARLDAVMRSFNAADNRQYTLSISYGMACSGPGDPLRPAELFLIADDHMYEDKRKKSPSVMNSIIIPHKQNG